jgi:hypothetical protein
MRNWQPQSSLARWVATVLLVLTLAGSIFFLIEIANAVLLPPEQWPVNDRLYMVFLGFIALVSLSVYLAYRVAGAFTLRYSLDRNGLYIHWLGNTAIIPLGQITTIESGAGYELPRGQVLARSIGFYRGQMALPGGRPLQLFGTASPISPQTLIVHTADAAYALSPVEPDTFVQELEQRRRLGVIQQLTPTIKRGGLLSYAFWADHTIFWAISGAVVLNLMLFGIAMLDYQQLPSLIQFRFDQEGNLAELRPRHQILFLPLAAATIMLLNAGFGLVLYSREVAGARLLQFGSIIVQVLFGVAIVAILL